jgi:flagellar biosynthesis/type III secretory pathway protein FliH
VEHSAPVSHALPVIEGGPRVPVQAVFAQPDPPPEEPRAAMVDTEHAVQLAYRQGVEAGIAEGERRAEAVFAARNAREQAAVAALGAALQEQFTRYAERLERESFRFALAAAGKIARREIALDSETILRQVKEAFHRVVGAETITLRVHPEDEPLLRPHKNELLASSDGVREVIFEPDDAVERGGCIIESPSGNIDARIATQLAQIDSALFGNARNAGANG